MSAFVPTIWNLYLFLNTISKVNVFTSARKKSLLIACYHDRRAYTNLFRILESFGECSGLKVNDEKTEIVPLGDISLQEQDFPKHSICEVIKILVMTKDKETTVRWSYTKNTFFFSKQFYGKIPLF